MTSAAEMLKRALAGNQGHRPEPITDEFAQAIARQLEAKQIAKVPGLPSPEPEPEWYDRAAEFVRRTKELEDEREASRRAEEAAQNEPDTTVDLIRQMMDETYGGAGSAEPAQNHHETTRTSRSVIPLNGAAVLRAALAGGHGIINGESR